MWYDRHRHHTFCHPGDANVSYGRNPVHDLINRVCAPCQQQRAEPLAWATLGYLPVVTCPSTTGPDTERTVHSPITNQQRQPNGATVAHWRRWRSLVGWLGKTLRALDIASRFSRHRVRFSAKRHCNDNRFHNTVRIVCSLSYFLLTLLHCLLDNVDILI